MQKVISQNIFFKKEKAGNYAKSYFSKYFLKKRQVTYAKSYFSKYFFLKKKRQVIYAKSYFSKYFFLRKSQIFYAKSCFSLLSLQKMECHR